MSQDDYARRYYADHSFGAVAYSVSTGRWGVSWFCTSWDEAAQAALAKCGPGGQVIERVQGDYYIALAVTSGGDCATDWNANPRYARRRALRKLPGSRIVVIVHCIRGVREEASQALPVQSPSQPDPNQIFLQRIGYGAIACSPSTGLFSYAIQVSSYADAEAAAIRSLQSQPGTEDAVAGSGFDTYITVAVSRRESGLKR